MREAVVKRYVKAILSSLNQNELNEFIKNLGEISAAFEIEKFKSIINIPTLKTAKKVEFTLSLLKDKNKNFENFIRLLGANKRLFLIPAILNEIKSQQAKLENIYQGNVCGKFKPTKDEIKALEENFSKKFNAKVKLSSLNGEQNGIKIELDSLGVEVDFSIDRLKKQLSEHILKAI